MADALVPCAERTEDPPAQRRAHQDTLGRNVVVLVVGESPVQAGLGRGIGRVGHEAGGGIAPGREEFGQRGERGVERAAEVGAQLVRPAAGHDARVRWQGPRGRRPRLREEDTPGRETFQIRGRGPWVSIRAQPIGPNRIQHDQQDVRGPASAAALRRPSGGGARPHWPGTTPQPARPRPLPGPAGCAVPWIETGRRTDRFAATVDKPGRGQARYRRPHVRADASGAGPASRGTDRRNTPGVGP